MIKQLSSLGVKFPKATIVIMLAITAVLAMQLDGLRWETDARVYLPKGHEAILYDEKVDEIFGVKDNVIIGIVNEEQGIFNTETLQRIKRVTDKIAALDGVQAQRSIDVASISSATYFSGDETSIASKPLMEWVPQNDWQMQQLKKRVYDNADLFVGNIVSANGKAAMIRAKLKEGMANRWMTYFQIKGILAAEGGEGAGWNMGDWGGGKWEGNAEDWKKWQKGDQPKESEEKTGDEENPWWPQDANSDASQNKTTEQPTEQWPAATPSKENSGQPAQSADNPWWPGEQSGDQAAGKASSDWPAKQQGEAGQPTETATADSGAGEPQAGSGEVKDKFYLAGRPVVEVTSGIYAMDDMKLMIPLIILVMAAALFLIFRTLRGVFMPLIVMSFAIIWTMGIMVLLDVPLYTISSMLPVILVAVGIGDAIHFMSNYYDNVLKDPHRDAREIVTATVQRLGAPLITTSVTTAIGFLALIFAEMPPFRIFGLFAVLGILLSWLITITLIPALLCMLKPKVGGYYARRRAMRVYDEQSRLAWMMKRLGRGIENQKGKVVGALGVLALLALTGASQVYVNSSWLSDFREDSEVAESTAMINDKFDGSMFLHVVIESDEQNTLKRPQLLQKMQALQEYAETLPYVGGTLSIVDYLQNMNMNLHAGDKNYNVLPETQAQIAEYLFLLSVSGRPELLDEVVDYNYQRGLISIAMKTDYTRELKSTISQVEDFIDREFQGLGVKVNLAGSANNSYIWGDLLIGSQTSAIVLSKLGILVIASLIFMSVVGGIYVVIPVTFSTALVAGCAGVLDIPLDVSTALAAGIAIGVGVDYAVHYLFRYRHERNQGKSHQEASEETLRSAGRTIVLNALVVTAGFAVLFFSQFPPHVKLGYFVASYMIISCIIAVIVLPALLSFFRPKFAEARQA